MQQQHHQNQPAVINMQQQQQPGQGTGPTVIMTSPNQPDTYPSLNGPTCRNLGIVQLSFGIITLVLDFINIILYASYVQGIWAGILIIIPGALGMAAAKSKSRGMVVATGVMSIIAAVLAFSAMATSFSLATVAIYYRFIVWIVLEVVIGLIFLAEIGIAIGHAVVCLQPACSTSITHTTSTTVVASSAGQAANTTYPQGQPGHPQGQPGYPQGQPGYPQGQPGYPQGQPWYHQGQDNAGYVVQPPAYDPNQGQKH